VQADRLHVAVRPRGILECLDLAVTFCGRRPLAVALATALGAAPCILVNRLLFSGREASADGFLAFVLLGVEAAWASVPLTLYLGQAVFSERFSWRRAGRDLLVSLPGLGVFQGILRGTCLLMVVLTPVAFIGTYYLNQVILLERPRFGRIWSRRTAINRRHFGVILSLALVDAAILIAGLPLGTRFLAAVSAIWRGRGVSWLAMLEADGFLGATIFSWHGQITFWSLCGLVTVFRFFTYLDTRIRREGWDVELKLRAESTYAGIGEPVVPAVPRPARARLLAALGAIAAGLTIAAGAAAAAAPGDTIPPGAAQRALSRQAFPWYDSEADRYRPLIRPTRADEGAISDRDSPVRPETGRGSNRTTRGGGWSGSSPAGGREGSGRGAGNGSGPRRPPVSSPPPPAFELPRLDLGNLGWILMVLLFAAGLLAAIYLAVRYGLARFSRPETAGGDGIPATDGTDEQRLAALPVGTRLPGSELLARAAAHAERGEFERAIVYFHAWQLVELDRTGILVLAVGKTNGQYAAEVTAASPALAPLFLRSNRLFEDAFFGALRVSGADFRRVWDERARIEFHAGVPGA